MVARTLSLTKRDKRLTTATERRKINNYYKLLTSLINCNYTRDRSSFKSLSLWSLRYVSVCECVSHYIVCTVCTGACVNIFPEWFDQGVWKIEYTLSIVGSSFCVFFFLVSSIRSLIQMMMKSKSNSNSVDWKLKELGVNQKIKNPRHRAEFCNSFLALPFVSF